MKITTTFFKCVCIMSMIFLGVGSVMGETVTYTISAKNTLQVSGEKPEGSNAEIVETYSTSKQMISGNSQTLTLTGFKGCKITQITLSMKSNKSSGAGSFTYSLDGNSYTDIVSNSQFNNANWNGAWSSTYTNVIKTVDIDCSDNIIFKIAATANSLYCESYSITYESPLSIRKPDFTPEEGAYKSPIEFSISAYGADTTVYYTTNGEEPTTSDNVYTSPFTISETTTVKAIAVAGEEKSFVATATYTFPIFVSDINSLLERATADNDNSIEYKIKGSVSVVYQNGSSLYVEDESGALLIYGSVSETYSNGEVLTGVIGTFTIYNNLPEMIPVEMPVAVAGSAIEPTLIIDIPVAADASKYIKIENVTFTEDPSFSTSSIKTGTINFAGSTLTVRDNFKFGFDINTEKEYDIIGVVCVYNTTIQVYPIEINEVISTDPVIYISDIEGSVDFGDVVINETSDITFKIEGENLTEDILFAVDNSLFTITPASITPVDGIVAETTVTISFSPIAIGLQEGKLTISTIGVESNEISIAGYGVHPTMVAPKANEATEITKTGFVANWEAVDNATSYEVNVWNENIVFEEDFSSITAGDNTLTSGSNTSWTKNNNFSAVENAYQAGGAVKIGTGSKVGSVTTKELNLSSNNGVFTLVFDVKGWTKVEGDIIVTSGDDSETVKYTAIMDGDFETKSVTFTNGTINSIIKIEATRRAFIDNITIIQGSESTTYTTIETTLSVTELAEGTCYVYNVVAKADGYNDSEVSNKVSLVTLATPVYTIKVVTEDANFGTVSVNDESEVKIKEGESATFTATPASNYEFVKWTTEDANEVSTANPYTIESVNADIKLIAVFKEINDPTSIDMIVNKKPYVSGGHIFVPAQEGQTIEVFNVMGQKVTTVVAGKEVTAIKVLPGQIYMVSIGTQVVKVKL